MEGQDAATTSDHEFSENFTQTQKITKTEIADQVKNALCSSFQT